MASASSGNFISQFLIWLLDPVDAILEPFHPPSYVSVIIVLCIGLIIFVLIIWAVCKIGEKLESDRLIRRKARLSQNIPPIRPNTDLHTGKTQLSSNGGNNRKGGLVCSVCGRGVTRVQQFCGGCGADLQGND